MSDETMSEAQAASDPNDTPTPAREPRAEGPSSNEPKPTDRTESAGNPESTESTERSGSGDGSGPGLGADGQPRKRRRRGSRGGRNRSNTGGCRRPGVACRPTAGAGARRRRTSRMAGGDATRTRPRTAA